MNIIIRSLIILSSVTFYSDKVFGQLVSDKYCQEFKNVIATPLNPTHWYSNIVFKDECRFEFDIDAKHDIGILFILERNATEKVTRKSLHSDIEMYESSHFADTGKDVKFPKFPKNNFWDEAYFFENYGPILLRKKRTFITIFCDNKELCPELEKKLRNVSILQEF